jgi:conjugal transfer mating pair stabilization protein TraN
MHDTFTPLTSGDCTVGDKRIGNSCSRTYAASYQAPTSGYYYCSNGGSLSGSTCTKTYSASYATTSGGYYCPNGGSLSGSTCTYAADSSQQCPAGYTLQSDNTCMKYLQSSSSASGCPAGSKAIPTNGGIVAYNCYDQTNSTTVYSCPSGGTLDTTGFYPACKYNATYGGLSCNSGDTLQSDGTTCKHTYAATVVTAAYISCDSGGSWDAARSGCWGPATANNTYSCPHANDTKMGSGAAAYCRHDRPSYTTKAGCQTAGFTWGTSCYNDHATDVTTTYSCPAGALGPSTSNECVYSQTQHPATYSCNAGDTLSSSTCTHTYNATATGYYYCPSGGNLSGTTCTQTSSANYQAPVDGYSYCASGGTLSGTKCTYTYSVQ